MDRWSGGKAGLVAAVGLVCVIALTALFLLRANGDDGSTEPPPLTNPDRTMRLGSDGLSIDLVDAAESTAESWSSGTMIEPAPEFAMTSEGVLVPEKSSGYGGLWLLIQDSDDPKGVSSLVNVLRDVDGSLNEMQLRLWQHQVEFVWVSEVERTWTVSWDGGPPQPLAETSFTHRERSEESRTYTFTGVLADATAPEGTPGEATFMRGIPGRSNLDIPEEGGAPTRLTTDR